MWELEQQLGGEGARQGRLQPAAMGSAAVTSGRVIRRLERERKKESQKERRAGKKLIGRGLVRTLNQGAPAANSNKQRSSESMGGEVAEWDDERTLHQGAPAASSNRQRSSKSRARKRRKKERE